MVASKYATLAQFHELRLRKIVVACHDSIQSASAGRVWRLLSFSVLRYHCPLCLQFNRSQRRARVKSFLNRLRFLVFTLCIDIVTLPVLQAVNDGRHSEKSLASDACACGRYITNELVTTIPIYLQWTTGSVSFAETRGSAARAHSRIRHFFS